MDSFQFTTYRQILAHKVLKNLYLQKDNSTLIRIDNSVNTFLVRFVEQCMLSCIKYLKDGFETVLNQSKYVKDKVYPDDQWLHGAYNAYPDLSRCVRELMNSIVQLMEIPGKDGEKSVGASAGALHGLRCKPFCGRKRYCSDDL